MQATTKHPYHTYEGILQHTFDDPIKVAPPLPSSSVQVCTDRTSFNPSLISPMNSFKHTLVEFTGKALAQLYACPVVHSLYVATWSSLARSKVVATPLLLYEHMYSRRILWRADSEAGISRSPSITNEKKTRPESAWQRSPTTVAPSNSESSPVNVMGMKIW